MTTSRLKISGDAAELLSPAARVEHRPTPLLLRLACWGVVVGTASLCGIAACETDVVAAADGELVPTTPPERLHAVITGTLGAVHVKVGQRVCAGERLGELDPVVTAGDVVGLTRQRDGLEAQAACLGAAAADPGGAAPVATAGDGPDRRAQFELAAHRRAEFVATHEQRTAQVAEAQAARDAAAHRKKRLKARVELLAEKEKLLARAPGANSRFECIEAQLNRQEAENQLVEAADAERDWQGKADARGADLAAFVAGWRRLAAEQQATAERELTRVRQELARAAHTADRSALRSRSAGLVVEVPTAAVGSSVQQGAPLFAVVSLDSPLVVEADLAAADAPRVRAGCEVRVKLDKGFPYPVHGHFVGRVEHVAPHTAAPAAAPAGGAAPAREPAYRMRVAVERSEFRVKAGGAPVPFPATVERALELGLRPGAPVTTDALVGKRRVYEYLLDPLLRAGTGSFREP